MAFPLVMSHTSTRSTEQEENLCKSLLPEVPYVAATREVGMSAKSFPPFYFELFPLWPQCGRCATVGHPSAIPEPVAVRKNPVKARWNPANLDTTYGKRSELLPLPDRHGIGTKNRYTFQHLLFTFYRFPVLNRLNYQAPYYALFVS